MSIEVPYHRRCILPISVSLPTASTAAGMGSRRTRATVSKLTTPVNADVVNKTTRTKQAVKSKSSSPPPHMVISHSQGSPEVIDGFVAYCREKGIPLAAPLEPSNSSQPPPVEAVVSNDQPPSSDAHLGNRENTLCGNEDMKMK